MSNSTGLIEAKKIMGSNIIYPDELCAIKELDLFVKEENTVIPFSIDEIKAKSKDYILIYGCSKFKNGQSVNIKNLKKIFGDNPERKMPCFYFQDWYDKEDFINKELDEGWFFIRKSVYEESRSVLPNELAKKYKFPSAIQCVYSFFVVWLVLDEKLWYHDFVWCNDVDHNGDRIYVGKYNDIDGINKDGFSIHRHLALRCCYGCIDKQ